HALLAEDDDVVLAPVGADVAVGVLQCLELELAADERGLAGALAHPLLALLGAAQPVDPRLGLGRERDGGELLGVPLAAGGSEDLAADEDLAARALAGEAPGERARVALELVGERRAAAAGDERHAALDADREAELGLDVLADAVERVDEREGEPDRARRI